MQDYGNLHRALYESDLDTINSFVAARGISFKTEGEKWNLLHLSLLSVTKPPKPDVTQHLIELGVDVNAKDWQQWTPLHYAARTKNPTVVKLLIDAGADVNAEDDEGIIPLHQSVLQYPFNLEVIELFLAAGTNLTDVFRKYISVVASPNKREILELLAKYDKTRN